MTAGACLASSEGKGVSGKGPAACSGVVLRLVRSAMLIALFKSFAVLASLPRAMMDQVAGGGGDEWMRSGLAAVYAARCGIV